MGLESLELVVHIEDTFGIVISDAEAENIRTAGQLRDLVLSRLSDSRACGSMVAFNRLRRGLQVATRITRRGVKPHTRLDTLLPVRRRRSAWKVLASASQLKLPALHEPRWIPFLVGSAALLIGFAVYRAELGLANAILIGVLSLALLATASRATAILLPTGQSTVGQLAEALSARYPYLSALTCPDESEVWSKVAASIVRVAGVDPALITPDTHFVDDLGF